MALALQQANESHEAANDWHAVRLKRIAQLVNRAGCYTSMTTSMAELAAVRRKRCDGICRLEDSGGVDVWSWLDRGTEQMQNSVTQQQRRRKAIGVSNLTTTAMFENAVWG